MTSGLLLDTNIVIYYFDGIFPESDRKIDVLFENNFAISVISKIEFLGWIGFKEPDLYAKAKEFIDHAVVYYVDEVIADETIRIRRENKIKIPDAIIAATAIINRCRLATANTDDFKKTGISLINPLP